MSGFMVKTSVIVDGVEMDYLVQKYKDGDSGSFSKSWTFENEDGDLVEMNYSTVHSQRIIGQRLNSPPTPNVKQGSSK